MSCANNCRQGRDCDCPDSPFMETVFRWSICLAAILIFLLLCNTLDERDARILQLKQACAAEVQK